MSLNDIKKQVAARSGGSDNVSSPQSALSSPNGGCRSALTVTFAGMDLTLDAAGVIYVAALETLVVSDLHLEKGSRAAYRGRPVPVLDTFDTLQRLAAVVRRYGPAKVICLGDSFDDVAAGSRMTTADRQTLDALCGLTREWIWIGGNHDPILPSFCTGLRLERMDMGGAALSHEPDGRATQPQIVGHFHPKTSVSVGGHRFSGPCFCISRDILIMPAFGAYTGGLRCDSPVITALHAMPAKTFMLHGGKIWPMPHR